jgi:hypothetical protein
MAEPLVIEFREDRRIAVVEEMEAMAAAGSGWLNVSPGLDMDEAPPPQSGLSRLLGSRGPTVPLGTWTPAGKRDPSTVGIEHGEGPKAADRLAELGSPVPDGWRVLQDHPKRGLVVAMPPPTTQDQLDHALGWLLRATATLCSWPRTGEWRAACYRPS